MRLEINFAIVGNTDGPFYECVDLKTNYQHIVYGENPVIRNHGDLYK